MRRLVLLLIANFLVCESSFAQDATLQERLPPRAASALHSYVLQLTEFRMKPSSDPALTANEIVRSFEQMKENGKLEIIETVRLSALERHESMVQFGRSATVTVGVTAAGPGGRAVMRNTQQQIVGTLVRVTAEPEDGKILTKLSYEATRFEGEGKEDSPPDTTTFQVNTTLLLESGKPTLVAGTSAESASYLLVSIK